jgi:dynein heavy chain 1
MKFIEFLSKPSDRLNWEREGLPNDELCTENAIIMMNFNRYPLVIDPSD